MSGLDEILNLIEAQQQQGEETILKAAKSKAEAIKAEGDKKAQKAYDEFIVKAKEQVEKDHENACNSADAAMKRRVLSCKVGLIDEAIEKTVAKLRGLSDEEYFKVIVKLAEQYIKPESGVMSLCKKDMDRAPAELAARLSELAKKKGGSISLSKEPADIEDGFILSYGLISENCSFRAIVESEKDSIRDTAAQVLFGR